MSDVKEFYNTFTNYMLHGLIYDNPRITYITGVLRDVLRDRRFRRGLEVGCGIGLITGTLRQAIPDVTSLDISDNNIAVASAIMPQGRFLCVDFLEAPLDTLGGPYEFIGLFDVLEHLPASQHCAVFARLRALAETGACLAITIPTAEYQTATRQEQPELMQVIDESIDTVTLVRMAHDAGWRLQQYQRYAIDYMGQYAFLLFAMQPTTTARIPVHAPKRALAHRVVARIVREVKAAWRRIKYAKVLRQFRGE